MHTIKPYNVYVVYIYTRILPYISYHMLYRITGARAGGGRGAGPRGGRGG